MKKPINIISILLICTLALSSAPIIFGNYASASYYNAAANFLPNKSYYNVFDTAYEEYLSQETANYITSELSDYYSQLYPMYDCTVSDYKYALAALQILGFSGSVVFSKGHRTVLNVTGNNHYGLIDHNGNPFLDYEIYDYASSSNKLTFIWHCQTADHYSGDGTIPKYSDGTYYGLPYCFTHNPNMQKYGSSGSQVYLGWTDKNYTITWVNGTKTYTGAGTAYPHGIGSPQYEWVINSSFKFCQVAGLYWYNMGYGYQTEYALYKMAKTIYGTDFYSTELNNWLIGYGNMWVELPE